MIDLFFKNQWRRLSETNSERSIVRHQARLMVALYARRSAQRTSIARTSAERVA